MSAEAIDKPFHLLKLHLLTMPSIKQIKHFTNILFVISKKYNYSSYLIPSNSFHAEL